MKEVVDEDLSILCLRAGEILGQEVRVVLLTSAFKNKIEALLLLEFLGVSSLIVNLNILFLELFFSNLPGLRIKLSKDLFTSHDKVDLLIGGLGVVSDLTSHLDGNNTCSDDSDILRIIYLLGKSGKVVLSTGYSIHAFTLDGAVVGETSA